MILRNITLILISYDVDPKYFDNIISDKNIEKKDEKYVIYKPNISPQVFDISLWGLAQEHNFSRDVSQWNQDDIMTFKRIICRFIPLIRFYDISPKDYMIKIKPYEEILSKEYRNDLLNYYMIPEYKPKLNNLASRYLKDINSVIIDQRHVNLLTNWIDRNGERKFSLYKFNLLYRASRDVCYPYFGLIFGYNNLYLHNDGTWTSYPDDNPCSYPKLDDRY
ncbi:BTB/POZ domain-containing protein [Rhizophagus irregularis DAOM 181602=DAOM 197198]|nr:BTB/POZ domain-containing protein [Rhizophagus irregularis DAOM 181602=DAOM 197198]